MIITGTLTLLTSTAYWYVSRLAVDRLVSDVLALFRFLFPDSPTNAWFLTPDERAKAVQRIKENQTGVENKHFKPEQYVVLCFTHPLNAHCWTGSARP